MGVTIVTAITTVLTLDDHAHQTCSGYHLATIYMTGQNLNVHSSMLKHRPKLSTNIPLAGQCSNKHAIVTSVKHSEHVPQCQYVRACMTHKNTPLGQQHTRQQHTGQQDNRTTATTKKTTTKSATIKKAKTKKVTYLSPRQMQSCPEVPMLLCSLGAVDPNQGQGGHPYQPRGSHAVHLLYLPNE